MTFKEYLNQSEPANLLHGSVMIEREDMTTLHHIPGAGYTIGLYIHNNLCAYHVPQGGSPLLRYGTDKPSVFALSANFVMQEQYRLNEAMIEVMNADSIFELMALRSKANWTIWPFIDDQLASWEKKSHSEPIRIM